MGYRDVTCMECLEHFRQGWSAVLHNGTVIGFVNRKGASVITKCAQKTTTAYYYNGHGKECQYD